MRWLCILMVMAATGCEGPLEGSGEAMAPLISVHLASEDEQPGFEPATFEGRTLFVAPEPVISDADLAAVEPERGKETVLLDLQMTPAGAERLRTVTAGYIGRPLVVMFDSEIIGAPIVRSEIGGRVQMAVPALSADAADEIVERVRARWPEQ